MKYLVLISLLLTQSVFAKLKIKPGKWNVQSSIVRDGQEIDPMAKMKIAMKKMTPEQRKQMEAMMGQMQAKMGQNNPHTKNPDMPKVGFDKNGMSICYTKEMLENGLDLKKKQEEQKCKVSEHKVSGDSITMNFKCENGSSGKGVWKVLSDSEMKGVMNMVSEKGEKSEIRHHSKFISTKCD